MNAPATNEVRIARARVTHISVSRLYNLGNYQNVKYEIGAEVPAEASTEDVFRELVYIMNGLKPIAVPHCKREYEECLKKTETEQSSWERDHKEEWTATMEAHALLKSRRDTALKALDSLGGHSEFRDAKQDWADSTDDSVF